MTLPERVSKTRGSARENIGSMACIAYGGGSGLLLIMSIFRLWMLLDNCANLATVCSTDLSSSSSSPRVAMVNARSRFAIFIVRCTVEQVPVNFKGRVELSTGSCEQQRRGERCGGCASFGFNKCRRSPTCTIHVRGRAELINFVIYKVKKLVPGYLA